MKKDGKNSGHVIRILETKVSKCNLRFYGRRCCDIV
jgi:hypothetical protein